MNTKSSSHFLSPTLFALSLFFVSTAAAAATVITEKLDRTDITAGDSAQLTITAVGSNNDEIKPSSVPGLDFVPVGRSSEYQSINGVATSSVSMTYEVVPQHPGTFTIPALSPGAHPLVLHVQTGQGSSGAIAGSQSIVPNLPPPVTNGLAGGLTRLTPDGAAFARLRLPKKELYVGETVPVEIQVGLRPGIAAELNGLPSLNADAFTLSKLTTQPEQTQEMIEGQSYTVLTWHSALAAVKPGDFSLSIETPLSVQVRVAPRRRVRHAGDPFDDPAFDDFFNDTFLQNFFGSTTEKQITVASDPDVIKVLALPTVGRPAGFSGAVGNFVVSTELSAANPVAGDPLTLHLKVTGTGSFDRVNSKMLGNLEGWKTYRPTDKFEPSDTAGYGGEKDFEQAVIPENPGRQTVPALTFSYFNPATRRYETKTTTPISIAVSPAPASSAPAITNPSSTANPLAARNTPTDDLRPDHVETGETVGTLCPLYFQPWFLASQGVLVLCFACAFVLLRHRERRANDTAAVRRRHTASAVSGHLAEMDIAASAGDAARFFFSARAALQQQLAARWDIAPASITMADLDERLNGAHPEIREIFALADRAAYSGQRLNQADFQHWREIVHNQTMQKEEV